LQPWQRRDSVGRAPRLVIETLQNLRLTSDAVARRCALGKETLNAISHLEAKQSTRFGGPARRKTCKQNSICVGLV